MQTKLRRYRSSLTTNGVGIVSFGIWSAIKLILMLMNDIFSTSLIDFESTVVYFLTLFIIFLFAIIVLGLHLYIGKRAYREAIDGANGSLYLIIIALLIPIVFFEIIVLLSGMKEDNDDYLTACISISIDLVKALILIDTIYSAIMSRRLAKKLAQ